MTDTPAPSVPTSPPAGPAVSPEIDALIDDVRDALRVTDDGKALASLAAVRTEVARLTKERDDEVLVSARRLEYIERLEAESCRLQQEALTEIEASRILQMIEPLAPSFSWEIALVEKLRRRISAHKEKEWARSSDISGKEKE